MNNFWKGLLFGLLGAVVWVITSVILGFGRGVTKLTGVVREPPFILEFFLYVGFAVMILTPVIFWIILPIKNKIKRKKKSNKDKMKIFKHDTPEKTPSKKAGGREMNKLKEKLSKKQIVGIGIFAFVLFFVCMGIIFGEESTESKVVVEVSEGETIEKQGKLTGQVIKEDITEKNICPKQGTFQSDWSYCMDLCLFDKNDSGLNWNNCDKICETIEYTRGSEGLKEFIKKKRCSKCGDC